MDKDLVNENPAVIIKELLEDSDLPCGVTAEQFSKMYEYYDEEINNQR
jgi:hypothetical protein